MEAARGFVGIARGLCVKQKLNPLNLKCIISFKCGVSNGVPSTWLQRVVVEEVVKQSSPKPISLLGSTSSIETHVDCFHLWYVFLSLCEKRFVLNFMVFLEGV
jgi:hypothetical protein